MPLLAPARLRAWPLPQPDEGGDKEHRGRVLVVGGAPSLPGAVILAATAALRAGAGKLQIAVPSSIAQAVGVAVPEALVEGLAETSEGGIDPSAAEALAHRANAAQAVLVGPGLVDGAAVVALLAALVPRLEEPALVLDAEAFRFVAERPEGLRGLRTPAILTPHAGEMAMLLGLPKDEVQRDQPEVARRAAERFGAVVALKGAATYIAAPPPRRSPAGEEARELTPSRRASHASTSSWKGNGAERDRPRLYVNRAGNVGLATSGSGDTLSGVVAGLAARGAEPMQAACWGVALHAMAGDRLARRIGTLGFLARELLAEIPVVMHALSR